MRRRRGFALIVALWLLVAISAVMLEITLAARERRLAVANAADETHAREAALAALAECHARLQHALDDARVLTASRVDFDRAADPWRDADSLLADTAELGGARGLVELRDVGTMLDLDRASEDELRRLLVALRVDAGEADRIAQAIADWRDADDFRRARGAERDEYFRAGAPVLPRNGPFVEVSELRAVRGVSDDVYRRVRPYVTVRGSGQVNLNAAPRPVLFALPGIGEEAVAALERARRERRRIASLEELSLLLSPSARRALVDATPSLLPRVTFDARELEATSTGTVDGSPVRARVVALFARGGGTTFLVWRRVGA